MPKLLRSDSKDQRTKPKKIGDFRGFFAIYSGFKYMVFKKDTTSI